MSKKPTYDELEARIRELEKDRDDYELFRQMIENSLDPVFMIDDDDDCRMIYVNEAARKHYGASYEEIYGWRIPDWDPNFSYERLPQHVADVKASKHLDIETLHRVNGNEIVPVDISINLIKYKGRICHYGYIKNISDRKKAEQALKESNEKISLLMNSTGEGIIGIDLDGNCTYANKSGVELLGYKSEQELLGRNLHLLTHHSDNNNHLIDNEECKIQSSINNGIGTHVDDEFFWRADGSCFPVEYFSFPQFKNGQTVGAVITFNDISDRIQNENQIKQYTNELKELNATKDKFFSIVAHDLKSPFNAILGYLELLNQNVKVYDIETIAQQIEIVRKSAQNVFHLLEAILLWSSSQTGKIRFNPEPLIFGEICKAVIEDLKLNALSKNITLIYDEDCKLSLFADLFMIKTVLRNLISNAIKFTNPGGVVDITLNKQDGGVLITVKDNGIGIADENISKLFDIAQEHTTVGTAKERGTGLGLLICKDFIEKHNGKIWVTSELGKGSLFHIFYRLKFKEFE